MRSISFKDPGNEWVRLFTVPEGPVYLGRLNTDGPHAVLRLRLHGSAHSLVPGGVWLRIPGTDMMARGVYGDGVLKEIYIRTPRTESCCG